MRLFPLGAILAGALLGLAGCGAKEATPDGTGQGPLPADVIMAWKKFGASSGWAGPDKVGYLAFREGAAEGKTGEIPAFRLSDWAPGSLAKLPAPSAEFCLDLSNSAVTAAKL